MKYDWKMVEVIMIAKIKKRTTFIVTFNGFYGAVKLLQFGYKTIMN